MRTQAKFRSSIRSAVADPKSRIEECRQPVLHVAEQVQSAEITNAMPVFTRRGMYELITVSGIRGVTCRDAARCDAKAQRSIRCGQNSELLETAWRVAQQTREALSQWVGAAAVERVEQT